MADDKSVNSAPALSTAETLRWCWKQLTSMRTALILLFAVALASIPGSLVPQRPVSPVLVDDFIAQRPRLSQVYEAIGMFDVYASVWFSAIYLLLLVSLLGCIVPRSIAYAKAIRAEPTLTPKRLSRMPEHLVDTVAASPAAVLDAAESLLRRRRYRVVRRRDSIAAERGYLREAGNLVFHLSLIVVLFGVAIGGTGGFKGTALVVVGQGFTNNITQYDDFTAGARFNTNELEPFTLTVDNFDAQFEAGQVQTGAARVFNAEMTVVDRPGDPPRRVNVEVNKPLIIDGTTVHLVGHGYAARVTVRDGDGQVAFSGPVPFLPQDGNFSSAGAIKAPDARPERLAFQGFFLPTAVVDDRGPRSLFPDAVLPELFLNAWYGPPRAETGRPESVYSLDITGLTQVTLNGDPLRIRLSPGEIYDLPDGRGSITMDGWDRWVNIQIADQPGLFTTFTGIAIATIALCVSLFVRPRRIWVRARPVPAADGGELSPAADGGKLETAEVEVAGLDRADGRIGLDQEVAQVMASVISEVAPSEPRESVRQNDPEAESAPHKDMPDKDRSEVER